MLHTCVINLQPRETRAHSRVRVPLNHTGRDGLSIPIVTTNAVWLVFVWIIDALLALEGSNIGDLPVGLAVTAPQVKEPSWSVGLVRVHVLRHGVPASAPLPFYALT